MIPVIVVGIYLAIIAVIGSVAFRKGKQNTEDFFLASRTIGIERQPGMQPRVLALCEVEVRSQELA